MPLWLWHAFAFDGGSQSVMWKAGFILNNSGNLRQISIACSPGQNLLPRSSPLFQDLWIASLMMTGAVRWGESWCPWLAMASVRLPNEEVIFLHSAKT